MIFIKDGNLIRGVRILLILLGIGAIYIAVQFITPPSGWGIALMLIGLVLMAIGGDTVRDGGYCDSGGIRGRGYGAVVTA